MPRLPRISGKEIIKRLEHAGWYKTRQKGSHVWLAHKERPPTAVPLHDVVGPGLLRQILREIKMPPEEFSNL